MFHNNNQPSRSRLSTPASSRPTHNPGLSPTPLPPAPSHRLTPHALSAFTRLDHNVKGRPQQLPISSPLTAHPGELSPPANLSSITSPSSVGFSSPSDTERNRSVISSPLGQTHNQVIIQINNTFKINQPYLISNG